jgi:hypothetical protein
MAASRSRALRLMPKLYAATGGKPQYWETLDNLGAVQADAPAIVYAVEMGWILVAPKHDPHSMSLTEAGRRAVKKPAVHRPSTRSEKARAGRSA